MGIPETLSLAPESEPETTLESQQPAPTSPVVKQTKQSYLGNNQRIVEPPKFTLVQISTSIFSVQGLLKRISRGGAQVSTPAPVPTRSPLQISMTGCLPVDGEAFYCMKRSLVYRVGIVFSSLFRPTLPVGAAANVDTLDAPFAAVRGSVVDMKGSTLSIFAKAAISPGSWVRVDSSGWIFFGVVKDLVPSSMLGRYLNIHLEAAFPASSAQSGHGSSASSKGWGPERDRFIPQGRIAPKPGVES